MSTDIVFNHTAHQALWDWLMKNPGVPKDIWPGWIEYPDMRTDCFACEYVNQRYDGDFFGECGDVCPLVWPDEKSCFGDAGENLFSQWERALESYDVYDDVENQEERMRSIARQIRDLPVREGVKYI